MPDPGYNTYDSINTTAARWLLWNRKERQQLLGIKKFNRKNYIHMWLLHIMNAYSIANGYEYFYIESSLIDYLIIRYINNFKYVKRARKNVDLFLIEPDLFAKEVCQAHTLKDTFIIQDIYKEYWRDYCCG